jgi:hypothetical protein
MLICFLNIPEQFGPGSDTRFHHIAKSGRLLEIYKQAPEVVHLKHKRENKCPTGDSSVLHGWQE